MAHSHGSAHPPTNTQEPERSGKRRREQEVDPETAKREDAKHFQDVLDSFKYYPTFAFRKWDYVQKTFEELDPDHQALLPRHNEKMEKWTAAIQANSNFLDLMVTEDAVFGTAAQPSKREVRSSDFNMEKVVSTLRQISREWAPQGQKERDQSYGLILAELEAVLPVDPKNLYQLRVLCPGSGIGRLPFEICKRGYACQGNEWSYYMLIAGNHILNQTTKDQYVVYPFIHQTSNIVKIDDQFQDTIVIDCFFSFFREVRFPDVETRSLPQNADFSYAAGDFIEVYGGTPEAWDCVITCFFMDTANNIIEYVETIYKILKPGGRWINFGPLLYHYSDMAHEQSVEISLEEILDIAKHYGFVFEKESLVPSLYTYNELSLAGGSSFVSSFTSALKTGSKVSQQ